MGYRFNLPQNSEMFIGEFHSVRVEVSDTQKKMEEHISSGISLCTFTEKGREYRVLDSAKEVNYIGELPKIPPNYILPAYKCYDATLLYKEKAGNSSVDGVFEPAPKVKEFLEFYKDSAKILSENGFKLKKLLIDEENSSYSIWKGNKKKGSGIYKVFSPGIEFYDPLTDKVFLKFDIFDEYKLNDFYLRIQRLRPIRRASEKRCRLMLTPNALSSLVFALLFWLSQDLNRERAPAMEKITMLSQIVINAEDNKIVEGTIDGDGNFYTPTPFLKNDCFSGLTVLQSQRWKVDYKAVPIKRPHKISILEGKSKSGELLDAGDVALVNDFKFENNINFNTMDFFSTITVNIYKNSTTVVGQRSFPFKGNVLHILSHVKEMSSDRLYGANTFLVPYALTDINI